jgi:hypothetical protein
LARGLTGAEVGVAAEEGGDIYVMSLGSRCRAGVTPTLKRLLKTLVEELNRLAGGP